MNTPTPRTDAIAAKDFTPDGVWIAHARKLAGVCVAVSRWPEDERKYVPDPVRWFKRGNYDDDPETWQRKSANGVPQLEARFDVF